VSELLGQQRPYPPAPHGSEIPFERYLRGW
jgi:hypothetical protein